MTKPFDEDEALRRLEETLQRERESGDVTDDSDDLPDYDEVPEAEDDTSVTIFKR